MAREYKERGLPLSVIVIDYFHWTLQGDWKFEPSEWPDPAAMVKELDQLGIKLMVSVWPNVNPASENYAEMAERGLLIENEHGLGLPARVLGSQQPGRPDPDGVLRLDQPRSPGTSSGPGSSRTTTTTASAPGGWTPASPSWCPRPRKTCATTWARAWRSTNIYPMLHARGFYEHMQAEGETEILSLCRSAWAGSQRYGALVWSGRHRLDLRGSAPPDRRGPEHRPVRHPLVDHGHRRVQERQHQRPVVPRADRALVPVRRVLPGVPAARGPPAGHPGRLGAHRRGQRGVELRRPSSTRSSAA